MARHRRTFAALTAALIAAVASAPAGAQEAPPAPSSCGGLAFTDAPGDHTYKTPSLGTLNGIPIPPSFDTTQKAPDNYDITNGFFRYVNKGGKDVLTANLQIANLDQSVAPFGNATGYWFYYTVGETLHFVMAKTEGEGWTFHYGTSDVGFTIEGDTPGKAHEGANGIIEMELPVKEAGLAGKSLTAPYAYSTFMIMDPNGPRLYQDVDTGPDDITTGKTFKATVCAADNPAAPAGETPPPVAGETPAAPAPTQAQTAPSQQQSQAPAPAPTTKSKSAAAKKKACQKKAKKLKNKKKRKKALKRCAKIKR